MNNTAKSAFTTVIEKMAKNKHLYDPYSTKNCLFGLAVQQIDSKANTYKEACKAFNNESNILSLTSEDMHSFYFWKYWPKYLQDKIRIPNHENLTEAGIEILRILIK